MKKKRKYAWKRITAVAMSIVMLLTMIPVTELKAQATVILINSVVQYELNMRLDRLDIVENVQKLFPK